MNLPVHPDVDLGKAQVPDGGLIPIEARIIQKQTLI
jgi:hypothetical protein